MRPHALEQLFVRRSGGRVELMVVLVNPAEARTRETLHPPTADEVDAVRWLGRHLARGGEVHDFRRLRVRVERGGRLVDDPALGSELLAAFREELRVEAVA